MPSATFMVLLSVSASLLTSVPSFADANNPQPVFNRLISDYIQSWKDFYPTRAFAYGDADSAAVFEDYSEERVAQWLVLNMKTLESLDGVLARPRRGVAPALYTDLRVLRARAQDELANWTEDSPLTRQPQWYAEQVSQGLTHLLVRDQLSEQARYDATVQRLRGVQRLAERGTQSLKAGTRLRTERALRILAGTRAFYTDGLRGLVADWPVGSDEQLITPLIDTVAAAITDLEAHLRDEILPVASDRVSIGSAVYAAKLARRTSGSYTPDRLRAAAAEEVQAVRALMYQEAARWIASFEDPAVRSALLALGDDNRLAAAIDAMEADRQDNSADFLASFTSLTFAAERFVEAQNIATIPKPTTLLVALSPAHFSGAAVGGVYPSGPFDTEANTLFYVPSIPDSAAADAKEGFYRSFNTHFNTMILAHEMFPGHYLQYKVAVSEAPPVRSLFSNGSYTEGWGSFVEELMLDAGWADNAPLTRLAHLRKRLENATRAYVSVQVNTADWGEAEVFTFAQDEGLLAPQFATNLWQRVVNSPLQITDYFTGFTEFQRLYSDYRSGSEMPPIKPWVDAVLRAGPVPMALLEPELERQLTRNQ